MTFLKADNNKNQYMGLNNKICKNPVYFCKAKQVWLSEEDVQRKQCFCKLSFDMIERRKCCSIEKRSR